MKTKRRLVFIAVAALSFGLGGSKCGDKKNGPSSLDDPKQAAARNYYNEGRRLFLTCDPNNYPPAIGFFDKALEEWEEYPEALAAWAEAASMYAGYQINEQVYETALMRAQRAARLSPELDMSYRAAADLFRHRMDPTTGKYQTDSALQSINKAIALDPRNAENWYVLGSIYLLLDPKTALGHLEKARALNPNLGKTYFNLGGAHQGIALGLIQEAGKDAEKFKANKPAIDAHLAQAATFFVTYRKMVPDDIAGDYALAITYQNLGKTDEAEKLFKETVSGGQSSDPFQNIWRVRAYLALADLEVNRPNLAAARVYLERVLQLDANNGDAINTMMFVCTKQKDEACLAQFKKKIEEIIAREQGKQETQAGSTAEPSPQAGSTEQPAPRPGSTTSTQPAAGTEAPAPLPGGTQGGTP